MSKSLTMKNLLFFLLISLPFLNTSAQRTCASMEVLQQQLLEDPDYQNRIDAIEAHTAAYVAHHEHGEDGCGCGGSCSCQN